jgi:hypothetical protein
MRREKNYERDKIFGASCLRRCTQVAIDGGSQVVSCSSRMRNFSRRFWKRGLEEMRQIWMGALSWEMQGVFETRGGQRQQGTLRQRVSCQHSVSI